MDSARKEALRRWLTSGGLSYSQAAARLQSKWGVKTSPAALSNFYQRQCLPSAVAGRDRLILDVVMQSTRPIRLRILHCAARLKIITRRGSRQALESGKAVTCGGQG